MLETLGDRYPGDASAGMGYPGTFSLPPGTDERERRHRIHQKFVKDFLRSGRAIDDYIGRLLDFLDTHGLAENTIVIYTSDQGCFLGEHGFFDKRMMYEEPLRMPFVIRHPREIAAGARPNALVQNLDNAGYWQHLKARPARSGAVRLLQSREVSLLPFHVGSLAHKLTANR